MSFHIPSLIEVLAILIVGFLFGFSFSAGAWLFSKIGK